MEKRGLGRGLGALIPGASRDERSVGEVAIDEIVFNPYQPRKTIDDDKFQELVKSVRLHGILQPIVIRQSGDSKYELVAGERRLRAATAAGLSRVPAVIRDFSNEQSLEVALIENIQREDIGPMETAVAYRRLADEFNLTQDEIAFKLGKSRSAVANTLRLMNLPADIQDSLLAKRITEGHARALLSIADSEIQRMVWAEIMENELSVREAERRCREMGQQNVSRETLPAKQQKSPEKAIQPDPNVTEMEDYLRRLFGTRVNIIQGKEKGRVEIEFYTEEDLTRIMDVLGAGQ